MKYSGNKVLGVMSKYAKNRNKIIFSLILDSFNLSPESKTILEFGAGKGEFINRFLKYKNIATYAIEIDKDYRKILNAKHKTYEKTYQLDRKMNFIFCIDVLEHIKNDEACLINLFHILKKEGRLFLYVPARPELYSRFDKYIGHHRRYTLDELRSRVINAGFSIEKIYYHEFLGYFASIFNKLTSRGELNPRAVQIYDKYIFPVSIFIERLFQCPFGKSIILLAKKDAAKHEKKQKVN